MATARRAPAKDVPPPKRRLGLTAQPLPYSLHPYLSSNTKEHPTSKPEQPSPKSEPAWDAPPLDSSDESISPDVDASCSPALSDSELPAANKWKHAGFRVPEVLPRTVSDDNDSEDGHIKPTTFTSGGQRAKRSRYGLEEKQSREEFDDDEVDKMILGGSQFSQGKRSKTYKSRNLHCSAPSPSNKKAANTVVKKDTNGFKMPDTETMLAKFDEISSQKAKEFKQPPQLSSHATNLVKGSRRSARFHHLENLPTFEIHNPPAVPPRLAKQSKQKTKESFVIPAFAPKKQVSTEAAPFKMPAYLQEINNNVDLTDTPSSKETSNHYSISPASSISSLSSPPSSPIIAASASNIDFSSFASITPPSSAQNIPTHCPFCQDSISASALSAFTAEHTTSHRLTVRQQALFCRIHKTASAHETWKARGYPKIDWNSISTRLQRYQDFIISLIQNTRPSYYRTLLEQKVASGKNRTAVQAFNRDGADGGAEVGYYGSKGASIMMEHVVEKYFRELRKLAGEDKVVAAGGEVSGFVQKVLVPELVCRFVMDDMGLETEEAGRRVCEEGAELGALLCEDEDDQRTQREGEGRAASDVEDYRIQGEEERGYGE